MLQLPWPQVFIVLGVRGWRHCVGRSVPERFAKAPFCFESLGALKLCRKAVASMAEASYTDADFFLNQLNSCMDQGRCAEAFFRILCNGDALRQKVHKILKCPYSCLRYSHVTVYWPSCLPYFCIVSFSAMGLLLMVNSPRARASFLNFHFVFSRRYSKHSSWCC